VLLVAHPLVLHRDGAIDEMAKRLVLARLQLPSTPSEGRGEGLTGTRTTSYGWCWCHWGRTASSS
jgi:hypothetical protein